MAKLKLITLTSDFEKQAYGIANMEAVIYEICPDAKVIHLMHGIQDFDIITGAWVLESILYFPIGYHVCVIDPGVGTKRRALIIKTKRGDFLIGPDNGVLIPAARLLGIKQVVEITNEKYMLTPVSPVFHGRHIFAPVAAYLASGVSINKFGNNIPLESLMLAPYEEALIKDNKIIATVIQINKYGSLRLNILHKEFDKLSVPLGKDVELVLKNRQITIPYYETFAQIAKDKALILKDDFGRMEIAINRSNFSKKYNIKLGDKIIIESENAER